MAARKPPRPRGTGALIVRKDKAGNESWYGQVRVGSRLVKKRLGPKRAPGGRIGMTKTDAERALRAWLDVAKVNAPAAQRLTVQEAGDLLLRHLSAMGRKRSTMDGYDCLLRIHLAPYFNQRKLDTVTPTHVEAFIASKREDGLAHKTVMNAVSVLHSIFDHAVRRGWTPDNPVKTAEKPKATDDDPDIRYLDHAELAALLRSDDLDDLSRVLRPMYVTAAMTGMRQGELLALRWMDVDWEASRVRVRRNYVRGEYGTPKSKRSSRSVPLADRVAGELDRLHQASRYQADDDLVFAHPYTGRPIDRSRLFKRFKAALKRAGVRPVRFHDLRHTFGTTMAAQGTPIRTLQEWMGHRDFKTTLIYASCALGA